MKRTILASTYLAGLAGITLLMCSLIGNEVSEDEFQGSLRRSAVLNITKLPVNTSPIPWVIFSVKPI